MKTSFFYIQNSDSMIISLIPCGFLIPSHGDFPFTDVEFSGRNVPLLLSHPSAAQLVPLQKTCLDCREAKQLLFHFHQSREICCVPLTPCSQKQLLYSVQVIFLSTATIVVQHFVRQRCQRQASSVSLPGFCHPASFTMLSSLQEMPGHLKMPQKDIGLTNLQKL